MKSILQWKFIQVAGFPFKFPWFQPTIPIFHYSEGMVRVNNTSKRIIGVKMSDCQSAFPKEHKEMECIYTSSGYLNNPIKKYSFISR
jgi:hypothetical protein